MCADGVWKWEGRTGKGGKVGGKGDGMKKEWERGTSALCYVPLWTGLARRRREYVDFCVVMLGGVGAARVIEQLLGPSEMRACGGKMLIEDESLNSMVPTRQLWLNVGELLLLLWRCRQIQPQSSLDPNPNQIVDPWTQSRYLNCYKHLFMDHPLEGLCDKYLR
ncbi:hypothetical protein VTK26DRAFT_6160 [Humicola hyalothermophila]